MNTPKKKQANRKTDPDTLSARQRAAAEVLLTLGRADAPSTPGADHATPWDTVRSKEELLAALPPLPPAGLPLNDDSPATSLAHSNPVPVADRRGVFVERGNSGKSRVNRSGHKP
jgi:hypothetical protein